MSLISTEARAELQTTIESHYYNWSDSSKAYQGEQLITPVTLSFSSEKPTYSFDVALRSAHIYSRNNSVGQHGVVSTVSDTNFSSSIYFDFDAIKPFISFDMNIPTGKASLAGAEKNALMDGFLIGQTRFGEGWNYSPAIGFVYMINEQDSFTVSIGHNFRQKYVPDADNLLELDPGHIKTSSISYQRLAQNYFVSVGMTWAQEAITRLSGIEYYKQGKRFSVNLSGQLVISPRKSVRLDFGYTKLSPNSYYNSLTGNISPSFKNTNGDIYSYLMSYNHHYSDALQFSGYISFLDRNANQYQATDDLYLPSRKKYVASIGATYVSGPSTITGKINYFKMVDAATPFTLTTTTYTGFSPSLTLNYIY